MRFALVVFGIALAGVVLLASHLLEDPFGFFVLAPFLTLPFVLGVGAYAIAKAIEEDD